MIEALTVYSTVRAFAYTPKRGVAESDIGSIYFLIYGIRFQGHTPLSWELPECFIHTNPKAPDMTDLTTDNGSALSAFSALEDLSKICTEYETCHWAKNCKAEPTHLLICYKCNGAHAVCMDHLSGLIEQYGETIIFHDNICNHLCLANSVQILKL